MNLKSRVKGLLPQRLHPAEIARQRIVRHSNGNVIAGPFAGVVHLTHPEDFVEPSMLVGTYEKELHAVIERWLSKPAPVFIDVGAAQGYYSIGFGRRCPAARNIAFEMHEPRLAQLKRTAAANAMSVELRGQCTKHKLLEALALDDSIMIMDVEGYENELLDAEVCAAMKNCRVIIETHDHLIPNVTNTLKGRLSRTHNIELIVFGERTKRDLPFVIVDRWTLAAIDEGRSDPDQKWLIAEPKQLMQETNQ